MAAARAAASGSVKCACGKTRCSVWDGWGSGEGIVTTRSRSWRVGAYPRAGSWSLQQGIELICFPARREALEDRAGSLGGRLSFYHVTALDQQQREIALRTGEQHRASVLRGAVDHVAQHGCRISSLTGERDGAGQDAQIFRFAYRILELAVDGQRALDLLSGELAVAAGDVDFRHAGGDLRAELPVAQLLRIAYSLAGDFDGAGQLALLAEDDTEVVA